MQPTKKSVFGSVGFERGDHGNSEQKPQDCSRYSKAQHRSMMALTYCRDSCQYHAPVFLIQLQCHVPQMYFNMILVNG